MIARSAILTPPWRFEARRVVGPGMTAMFCGVNPSDADHEIDDQTVRKLYGFGRALGVGTWLLGNKFAFQARDVNELRTAADPIGPDNDAHIERMMREADVHVMAWGTLGKLPAPLRNRWRDIVRIAERVGVPLWSLGRCADGHPCHPLTLGYATPLTLWTPPA